MRRETTHNTADVTTPDSASTFALALLSTQRRFESFARLIAYLGGAAFLLLAIFMTINALARYMNLPFSGISDDVSVLVLGFASTWAFAYALAAGAHVQIDVLMPLFPPFIKRRLAIASLVGTAIVATMFAYQTWLLSIESYDLGITSVSMLRFPLYVPQAVVALGLTFLAIQAVLMAITQTLTSKEISVAEVQTSAV